MCVQCAAGVQLLASVTDEEFAEYFLWNETPFPFGSGEEEASMLLEAAAAIERGETLHPHSDIEALSKLGEGL